KAKSDILVDKPEIIKGKKVLVVEDGPTLTHGEMQIGAGTVAAERLGAKEIVDPRSFAVGSLKTTFETYPHLENVLPAMGYGKEQLIELVETNFQFDCVVFFIGWSMDLNLIFNINKPSTRIQYVLNEVKEPHLKDVLNQFIETHHL